jgi:small subunit ribosomal protein S2
LAVKEANTLGIPVIAMIDTNCDPEPIDYVIPSNDDAIRAIKLMVSTIASAAIEGRALLSSIQAEEEEAAAVEGDEAMERYLGPSTLAKLRAEVSDDDDVADDVDIEPEKPAADVEDAEEAEPEAEEEIVSPLAAIASQVTEEDVVESDDETTDETTDEA